MLTTNRLTHKDKPWHVPWPRTLAAKLVTKELTTPLIRHAAISKEETTTLKPLTALAISVVVLMPRGATVSTFQEDSHTWIHRIHSRARAPFSSIALWMFFWGISLTPPSLGLGHRTERKAAASTVSPDWTVDLRTVGFTGFAPKKETWGLHLDPNPLCFTDNNTLVATFITREDVTTLARRDNSGEGRPNRLHGIFLDAQTGKVQSRKEWSVPRPRGGIIPAGDGKFVVLTPAMVALYSPGFDLLKDFRLSPEQQSQLWDFHASPTGKSILVEYVHPEATYQWLDSDTLQPQDASWSDSLPVLSISDDKEIASFGDRYVSSKNINIFEALIQPRNGAERTVSREVLANENGCGEPEFLSNDLFALWDPHGLSVLPKTGGDALLRATFRPDDWLGWRFHASANGKRFAVAVWAHKGGSALLDISSHNALKRIVVYDIPTRQAVYTVDARKLKIKELSGVALSPEGSLIAVLINGVVQVYKLPLPDDKS